MTSPAGQQKISAAINDSTPSASSSASGAGASKINATAAASASHPKVVVGSSSAATASTTSSQNAQAASPAPVNGNGKGRSAASSAVPTVAHSRHSSVTMASNGPNSFAPNGGTVGGTKPGIQFGFNSPAPTHSTPETGNAAPIPIPGGNPNPRINSPAHSPVPIPQPSASGGRPPSSLQQHTGQMTFGSLGSDGEVSLLRSVYYLHANMFLLSVT